MPGSIEPATQPIISVSGLRGLIGSQLTPWVVVRYVSAYCSQFPRGKVVVARDGRQSGEMLSRCVLSTLVANGFDAIDCGVAATPTVGVLIRDLQAVGGIQISASHNPIEYNGLKLFNSEGRVIPAAHGRQVLEAYQKGMATWSSVQDLGTISRYPDPHAAHERAVLAMVDVERIRRSQFRVLLDSNRGAGSLLGTSLLEKLGCHVEVLGGTPDGLFEHIPEPIAENLEGVGQRVRQGKFDVGFCQDPDADRLALIDESGRYIGEEYTVVLCMQNVLGERPGPVVVNCASSLMSRWVAEEAGVPFHQSAVGEANVVDMMRDREAVFGGEGNGGPIEPRVGWVRDSFIGMAYVLDLMAKKQRPLSSLVASIPPTSMIKSKMELSVEQLAASVEDLKSQLACESCSTLDGVRLAWPDRWLLLRGSNTEPIVRLIAEAPTRESAEQLIASAQSIIARSAR